MKRILLIGVLFFINIISTFAAAWISDPLPKYYLFFQNSITKEIKYTKHNDFIFDHYFDKYINWANIWWNINIKNWKLIRLEETLLDIDTWKEYLTIYNSWSIKVWDTWLDSSYHDIWKEYDISEKNDLSKYKKLGFWDLNYIENIFLFIKIFFWFFWIGFLFFLPLNIITFFCFWYLFLKVYEKYNMIIFKNVYINSFIVYLISYILIIYNWLSMQELWAQHPIWFMTYFFFVWFWKFILFLISKYVIDSLYNKKYEKKVDYFYFFVFYALVFVLFIIYLQLKNIF